VHDAGAGRDAGRYLPGPHISRVSPNVLKLSGGTGADGDVR
jgi:hypothetical protein